MSSDLKPFPAYNNSGITWLGRVPEHWTVSSAKRHYSVQLGKMLQAHPMHPDDQEIPYLKAQHVQWFRVRASEPPKMWASPTEIRKFDVLPGDLLVCEGGEGGRCGLVRSVDGPLIIQNALHRVRPLKDCRNDYLQYVMSTAASVGWFDAINSKATIAHFTREKFGMLRIPVPPSSEQATIVRFLDYMDRRIRRYIRAKQKLIVLLNEQKQIIIQRAVTRGLDPGVRLKPSSFEWLGEVPEPWQTVQLRRLWSVTDCKHQTVPFVQEGIPLASVREAQAFDLSLTNAKRTTEEWYAALTEGDRAPRPGDLIYCRNVSVGAAAFVRTDERFAMGQDVCLIRSQSQNQRYLNYFMHSPAMKRQLALLLKGSTFDRINVSEIKGLIIPVPPRSEQDAITETLDSASRNIENGVETAARGIQLLREYRACLIADVVTGKIDVREVAARLPDEAEESEPLDDTDAFVEGAEEETADLDTAAEEA